jgi:hypothetical protein
MIVLMYEPRFADMVLTGAKRQTVRPIGKRFAKRLPQVGDVLSHRRWTGTAYRSPQIEIVDPVQATAVKSVVFDFCGPLELDRQKLYGMDMVEFARRDGFATWDEFLKYISTAYGLPFSGVVIRW